MKRYIFLRALGISVLYIGIFIALVFTQFVKHTSFTHLVGNMVISGNYRDLNELKKTGPNASYILEEGLKVVFGGMEFLLFPDHGFRGLDSRGNAKEITATAMTILDEGLTVTLSPAGTLQLKTHYTGGGQTLSIQATLPEGYSELRIPFKTVRSASLTSGERGTMVVIQHDKKYIFSRGRVDYEKRVLLLRPNESLVLYGQMPEKKVFNPQDFMVAEGTDLALFGTLQKQTINTWLAQWERMMGEPPDEETVIAYSSESIRRGTYRAAVASISPLFLEGSARTYRSSVFLDRLDLGLRSLSNYEREYLSRISRLANEKSPELLTEERIVYQLGLRGSRTLLADVIAVAKTIDPASITLPLAVGILEGWTDWKRLKEMDTNRLLFEDTENPFGRLIDQARYVLSLALRKVENEKVFVLLNDKIDVLFNSRTGMTLIAYGEAAGLPEWQHIGRSILASILKSSRTLSVLPSAWQISDQDNTLIPVGSTKVSFSRIYPYLIGETYVPRPVPLLSLPWPGVWAWTGAGEVKARYDGKVLTIAVTFPEGESHYLIIRGIKPFIKIQLYNIDYRTDPRFERYDSSGWAYSESEQTLLLKMKHRSTTEYIRIFYEVEAPPPEAPTS